MRVTVIGGSGRTGSLIVEQAIAAGHQVVATIRSPKRMAEMVRRGAGAGTITASLARIEEIAIARADVAAVVVATLGDKRSIGKAIQLSGGSSAFEAALNQALG